MDLPFAPSLFFVVVALLNFLFFGVAIVAVLWAIQRLRRVGVLERRLAELEARIWQLEADAKPR